MTRIRIKACAVALVAVLAMPGDVEANGFYTTMEMMGYCKPLVDHEPPAYDESNAFQTGVCFGMLAMLSLETRGLTHIFCEPEGVTVPQMARIFDAYAHQHPEIQHELFLKTALDALKQAFPCKAAE
jgi:hypothetical protein